MRRFILPAQVLLYHATAAMRPFDSVVNIYSRTYKHEQLEYDVREATSGELP